MGYGYGIKQCRETLLLLSSEEKFTDRMVSAISEICVISPEDVSKEHWQEIYELSKKFHTIEDYFVSKEGNIIETNKAKELRDLSINLVFLCVDIIEYNSSNARKQDT